MPLKLTKRQGSPYWYVRGTYRGHRVFESTGTPKRGIARQRQKDIETQIEKGGAFPKGTFGEACAEYLKVCPKSEYRYVRRLLEFFKDAPMVEIDQLAIERCAEHFYPDAQPATLNRNIFSPLGAILHRANALGLCPYIRISRRKEPRGRDVILTPEEASHLLDACSEKLFSIVLFMLTTGCRAGEAIKLTWEDIDLQRSHATLRDTKNGETYGVHLHPDMVVAFGNIPKRNDSVFGYTYVNRRALNRDFETACKHAGIKHGRPDGITPHSLRHTYATWHRQNGVDLRKLMELGRWKDFKSVMRYAHVSSEEQKAAIDALPVQNLRNTVSGRRK